MRNSRIKVKLRGEQVQMILARKNLSQNWLAQRIGTSSGYMSQLMNGKRCPSPQMRQTIQEVLKEPEFDKLFCMEGDST